MESVDQESRMISGDRRVRDRRVFTELRSDNY